jgi:hypothetical protein
MFKLKLGKKRKKIFEELLKQKYLGAQIWVLKPITRVIDTRHWTH